MRRSCILLLCLFSFCYSLQAKENSHNLVNIEEIAPDIILDIRYATANNFVGIPVYTKAACYLHKDVAKALLEVRDELKKYGLRIKIFDGYRPLDTQQLFWDIVQDPRYVANPAITKGTHTRGTAIDLTLTDLDGNELEMPTGFDDFTIKAHNDYEGASKEAKKNRTLLKKIMEKHHFKQLHTEWWHFNFIGWQNDEKYPPLNVSFEELE